MGTNVPAKPESERETTASRAHRGGGADFSADPGGEETDALARDWRARVAAHASFAPKVQVLFGHDGIDVHALVSEALALASPHAGSTATRRPVAAAIGEAGRSARVHGLEPPVLVELFGLLQDALLAVLLRRTATGASGATGAEDTMLSAAEAASRAASARRATMAIAAEVSAARDAETPEAGEEGVDAELARVLRHDIKTPLQAASLNLELLALESAESGLDAAALEVVQQSIDQAVAMLRRFDGSEG